MQTLIVIVIIGVVAIALIYLLTRNTSSAINPDVLQHDAKRFARLLVTEIKLYNASKIERGKRNNDIYLELAMEIDNARQMYDKRINLNLIERDYLDEQIIELLADGDATKMGKQYLQKVKH